MFIYKNKVVHSDHELQSFINFSNKAIVEINKKTKYGKICNIDPLYYAVQYNKIDIVKLLLDYAKNNNSIFNLNETIEVEKNWGWKKKTDTSLINATIQNNTEIFKLLIEYAENHNLILDINFYNNIDENPLYGALKNNNTKVVKLLIEYAEKHHIIIKMNESMRNPFLCAVWNNNIELVDLLIKNGDKHGMIIDMNNRD